MANMNNSKKSTARAPKANSQAEQPMPTTNDTVPNPDVSPVHEDTASVKALEYNKMMDRMITVAEHMSAVVDSMQRTVNNMQGVVTAMNAKIPGGDDRTAIVKIDELIDRIASATADKVLNALDESGALDCCGCCDDIDGDAMDMYEQLIGGQDDYDDDDDEDEDDDDDIAYGNRLSAPYIPRAYLDHIRPTIPAAPPVAPLQPTPSYSTVFNNCTFEGDVYIERDIDERALSGGPSGFGRSRYLEDCAYRKAPITREDIRESNARLLQAISELHANDDDDDETDDKETE